MTPLYERVANTTKPTENEHQNLQFYTTLSLIQL